MLDSFWKTVSIPPLTSSEIQVWWINLDHTLPSEFELFKYLSTGEVERSGRLRQGQVRMQFLAGRAWLRRLLGTQLGIAPETVGLGANTYGKPELHPMAGSIHFNVAHSRSTVLVAASLAGPIGIDVEYLDRNTDVAEVARHALTIGETERLLAISDTSDRNRAFFEGWTRKEAIVKADGRGLSLPLTSFDAPVGQPCQASLVDIPCAGGGLQRRYFVSDIALNKETACAIAVADRPFAHRLYTLTNSGFSLPN